MCRGVYMNIGKSGMVFIWTTFLTVMTSEGIVLALKKCRNDSHTYDLVAAYLIGRSTMTYSAIQKRERREEHEKKLKIRKKKKKKKTWTYNIFEASNVWMITYTELYNPRKAGIHLEAESTCSLIFALNKQIRLCIENQQ